ncbi:MAG: polysaccharide deacetylase family protein [Actinomycetota bacterium]
MASRRELLVSAAALALAACTRVVQPSLPPPQRGGSQITVVVNGSEVQLARGASVADALATAGITLRRGRLLDVDGDLLERHAVPPTLRIDGAPAEPDATLPDGAVVVAEDAGDRREDVIRERAKATRPNNPQFILGGEDGVLVTAVGEVSGKVVSAKFHVTKGRSHPKALALTFDDGPDPDGTPQILRILREEKVEATFFVVGIYAQRYPNLVRDILEAGHTVGTHSWSHPITPPFKDLPTGELEHQVTAPIKILEDLGVHPYLFRPPGGSYDDQVVEIAEQAGMRTVMWSIGTGDFIEGITPHHIVNAAINRLRPGGIVLLHDGGGDARATISALPDLVREIRRHGYDIAPVESDFL